MRFSVSIKASPFGLGVFLPPIRFCSTSEGQLSLGCGVMDFRKSLRQDIRLILPLERILNLDDGPSLFEEKCWKNLGKTGKQPIIIPIAISARLDFCQPDGDSSTETAER